MEAMYHHIVSHQMLLDYVTIASTGNATDFGDLDQGAKSSWRQELLIKQEDCIGLAGSTLQFKCYRLY